MGSHTRPLVKAGIGLEGGRRKRGVSPSSFSRSRLFRPLCPPFLPLDPSLFSLSLSFRFPMRTFVRGPFSDRLLLSLAAESEGGGGKGGRGARPRKERAEENLLRPFLKGGEKRGGGKATRPLFFSLEGRRASAGSK